MDETRPDPPLLPKGNPHKRALVSRAYKFVLMMNININKVKVQLYELQNCWTCQATLLCYNILTMITMVASYRAMFTILLPTYMTCCATRIIVASWNFFAKSRSAFYIFQQTATTCNINFCCVKVAYMGVGGNTVNIALQLAMQQCCIISCTILLLVLMCLRTGFPSF